MSKSSHHAIGYDVTAKEHIALAKKYNCPSISYTYTEPTIFLEYALETMKLAKKEGLKNIWVSNGYMSKETLEMILPYLDAANIDYKGNQSVYKSYCNSYNLKVLENIKRMKEYGVHIEVTTLLITGVNDSIDIIKEMAQDLIRYIGKDFIWHISRFFPHYKMMNVEATSISRLHEARSIAHSLGISKIYLGNV
jgi:pyruvate formate lyase activating enzyme